MSCALLSHLFSPPLVAFAALIDRSESLLRLAPQTPPPISNSLCAEKAEGSRQLWITATYSRLTAVTFRHSKPDRAMRDDELITVIYLPAPPHRRQTLFFRITVAP